MLEVGDGLADGVGCLEELFELVGLGWGEGVRLSPAVPRRHHAARGQARGGRHRREIGRASCRERV